MRIIRIIIVVLFLINILGVSAQADVLSLPKPGAMVYLSEAFNPVLLKGIKVHPENPFKFEFILDCGDGVNKLSVGYRHACTLQERPEAIFHAKNSPITN